MSDDKSLDERTAADAADPANQGRDARIAGLVEDPGEPPEWFKQNVEDNLEIYKREAALAFTIIQRNRHNSITGNWYGPDPEPCDPGATCPCQGCFARFTYIQDSQGG